MAEPRDRSVLIIIAVLGVLFVCLCAGVFLMGFGWYLLRSAPARPAPGIVVPQEAEPIGPADELPPKKVPAPRKNIPTH